MYTESIAFRGIHFFDGGLTMPLYALNCPSSGLAGNINKNRTIYRTRSNQSSAIQTSSILVQIDDQNGNSPESKKISGSGSAQASKALIGQANTVGIIGGVSAFSTLIFLEKFVWGSSRHGQECLPFVVCSDPAINRELKCSSSLPSIKKKSANIQSCFLPSIVQNLQRKRVFLEQSGARCIVMPCHVSHAWHGEISEGCSVPFLHIGDCVAKELKEAKLKPLEAGSDVRIGVLASDATLKAGFYQEKLQNQGFEVVLPDKSSMEHIVIPALEAFNRKDMEGARNLLRIAIQLLLVRAVNKVILASDEMRDLLPHEDPLRKKCIDPMDTLARATLKWAKGIRSTCSNLE